MEKMRFLHIVIAFVLLLVVPGCGIYWAYKHHEAVDQGRDKMLQAKAAYTECLKDNPYDSPKCKTLKEIYETEVKAYRTLTGSTLSIEEEKKENR